MSSRPKWQKIDPVTAETVHDILSEGKDLSEGMGIYGDVWVSVFWDSNIEKVGTHFCVQDMWVALDNCSQKYNVSPDKIRTVCQLLWQQPDYPRRGSLTLCQDMGKGRLQICEKAHDNTKI